MPQQREYIGNTTLGLNDVLYVVGGHCEKAGGNTKTILWSRPDLNGDLGRWQESKPFPDEGLSCSMAVSTPGHIHIIGGYRDSQIPSDSVWSAVLDGKGDFVKWETGPRLPTTLWFHNAAVVSGKVWVWGGLVKDDNQAVNTTVFSAPILANGNIGEFQVESGRIPKGFYRAAGTSSGQFLLSFCPSYAGGTESCDIWYAQVTENGLSEWQQLQAQLNARLYIDVTPDFRRGVIYLPGGRVTKAQRYNFSPDCYYFLLAGNESQATGQEQTSVAAATRIEGVSELSYTYVDAQSSVPGFLGYEQARQIVSQRRLPLVVYFHSDQARPCRIQLDELKGFNPANFGNRYIFACAESARFPQLFHQLGVFRAPAWILFDTSGQVSKRKIGVLKANEINQWLTSP
jgi:hypothetical protein